MYVLDYHIYQEICKTFLPQCCLQTLRRFKENIGVQIEIAKSQGSKLKFSKL